MKEADRQARNQDMLSQCNPVFSQGLRQVLADLESLSFRPRIQQAWRSVEEQERLFDEGKTKVRWGFHNATTPAGAPDSLAADVLDDDAPLRPSREYLLRLALVSSRHKLTTGIWWGLSQGEQLDLYEAIMAADWRRPLCRLGWDPCHVQVMGLTIEQARQGLRLPGLSGVYNPGLR